MRECVASSDSHSSQISQFTEIVYSITNIDRGSTADPLSDGPNGCSSNNNAQQCSNRSGSQPDTMQTGPSKPIGGAELIDKIVRFNVKTHHIEHMPSQVGSELSSTIQSDGGSQSPPPYLPKVKDYFILKGISVSLRVNLVMRGLKRKCVPWLRPTDGRESQDYCTNPNHYLEDGAEILITPGKLRRNKWEPQPVVLQGKYPLQQLGTSY